MHQRQRNTVTTQLNSRPIADCQHTSNGMMANLVAIMKAPTSDMIPAQNNIKIKYFYTTNQAMRTSSPALLASVSIKHHS
jgi:hypothetical protein